ncbi:DUF413 domain-containing protein [Pelagicoccus sp. SDUM812002]|uniref:DUF413 domain-containing protein n=1 Tax=Pelagicoccus sp. SDUM812002 TaxID=3041266 RepID=UPI00280D6770|nr:DUF413 domain-containing protein [Pelagicoccus sp. SDUM812002]MDQ8184609.1 DUF413 domain-containing protein [Pelagicoccus sp. SDUM812002]
MTKYPSSLKARFQKFFPLLTGGLLVAFLTSCTYLKYTSVHKSYKRIQSSDPSQLNLKHMIDNQGFYVIGDTADPSNRYKSHDLAVAAYSSKYQAHERVDTMQFVSSGTHFGLNLPEGEYDFLALADLDRDGLFEAHETVGRVSVSLDEQTAPQNILSHVRLQLGEARHVDWVKDFPLSATPPARQSVFYPGNAIRILDDPIFDPGMATLGMYDPAAFLESAPTLFYTLEEDLSYKIPVIFVHGIGGTPRSFEPLLALLDRTRYRPWFFYYPSGGDLNQQADMFYRIFLSGKLVQTTQQPFIVVAHSMGGIVVREALNLYQGDDQENQVDLFVTIASPFNGHAASAIGEKRGFIVLPAWRDLNPQNEYIAQLFRLPLPEQTRHQLIYAYRNDGLLNLGENSDGVVSVSSQLRVEAQQESCEQIGINNTHTGVLSDPILLEFFRRQLSTVANVFPEDHLAVLDKGGFSVPDEERYDPISRYSIEAYGHYMLAISRGQLEPIHPEQTHFIQVCNGETSPKTPIEKAWLKFIKAHPEILVQ